jgi:glycosyltransferase involved in cell wall biosynthesis
LEYGLKILVALTYYAPHWTGLTAHAVRVAEGLAARGAQVTVLTVKHQPDLARDEVMNGVRVVRLQPLSRFSRGMITPAFPFAAAKLIAEHDVVQIHTPLPEAPLMGALCRIQHKPMLMTHHGDLVFPPGLFNQFLQTAGYYVLLTAGKLASAVTSYSRDYAEHSRLLSRLANKLTCIFPPVDIPEANRAAAEDRKAQLGLQDKTLIGFAGRWVQEKGFDYLLQAFPEIKAKIPNAHLVYAGEPRVVYDDFYKECMPYIEPIKDDLTMVGLIREPQQMANFYAMCDVFAQPSRTDMMGLVQLEAMLCGTPAVVSDIPGARVVVRETGFGKLTPPGDPGALAESLVEVLENRERYRPTREEVRKHFSSEKSLNQYYSLLEKLVAREPVGARDPRREPRNEKREIV